jgi:hypothetical protein
MTNHRLLRATAAALMAVAGAAEAQNDPAASAGSPAPRGLFLAINADIYRPEPDFRGYIGRPTGVGGHVTIPVWTRGSTSLGLRGDAFWVRHFHKELTYEISVDREFYGGLLGPQLSLATGPVRPYVAAGYGTTRFWTVLNVDEGCDTNEPGCPEEDRTRGSDYEASTVLTGGVYIRFPGNTGNIDVLLHIAGQLHRGGTPDVRTLRDGTTPGQPDARYRTWQIGLSVGGR